MTPHASSKDASGARARWIRTTLGAECDVIAGFGFPERLQGKQTGDLPFYKVGDISDAWKRGDTFLTTARHYVTHADCGELRARPFPPGTTVFAKIGAAIALNRRAMLSEPSLVDNNVMGLHPRSDELDPKFLFHFACTLRLDDFSRATTVPSVRKSDIEAIALPKPPLQEQKQIVEEIEKQFTRLDAGVAALRRVQANLKRYRAAVLKAACEGRLVPTEAELARKEGRAFETGSALLARILSQRRQEWQGRGQWKEPSVPDRLSMPTSCEGWAVASIDQLADSTLIGLDRGRPQQSHDPGLGAPYIKMNNITMDGRVLYDGLVFVSADAEEASRFALHDGDLLFNTRNSQELVGKVGLVSNAPAHAVYNNNLMRIRLASAVVPAFVALQMCSHDFRRRMELIKKATTSVAAVYAKDLLPLAIALPPRSEQNRIVAEAECRLSVVGELEATVAANLQRVTRLRQSILRVAFNGRLLGDRAQKGRRQ